MYIKVFMRFIRTL